MLIRGLFENIPEGTKALFFVLAHEEAKKFLTQRFNSGPIDMQSESAFDTSYEQANAYLSSKY